MELRVLSAREASIFACLTDTVVAPEPILPPVRETDAVRFFDEWLSLLPPLNRRAMRGLLLVVEMAPLLTGFGGRLRTLDRGRRAEWLRSAERARVPQVRMVLKLVESTSQLAYYGNDGVLMRLGYDAEANLRRGRELRAAEGRP